MTALFRPHRDRRDADPYLPLKMLLFAAGAGFALAGFLTSRGWLINVGIAVLVVGLLLRLIRRRRRDDPDSSPD